MAALRGPWPILASVAGLAPIDLYGDEFPPSCSYVPEAPQASTAPSQDISLC